MEIYHCPVNCERLIKGQGPHCKLGYENERIRVPNSMRKLGILPNPTFRRPDRCIQDELAERETYDREDG